MVRCREPEGTTVILKGVLQGRSTTWIIRSWMILVVSAFATDLGHGQIALRAVTGRVTDDSGTIIEGAAVKLSNGLTPQVRSYVTQADGLYRFHGLHPHVDFTVRAQYEGKWSRLRTVSRFDAKSVVRIDLQIPADKRRQERQKTSGVRSDAHPILLTPLVPLKSTYF